MNEEFQFRLQAYADGEVPEGEAREIADRLANDADARALLVEFQNTRRALCGFEAEIKLPESREFYWSKIARRIEFLEGPGRADASSLFRVLRRWLLPAGALAALVIGGVLAGQHLKTAVSPDVEVALAGSDPFTYHNYSSGATLVWVSYPADNDVADGDSDDTMD